MVDICRFGADGPLDLKAENGMLDDDMEMSGKMGLCLYLRCRYALTLSLWSLFCFDTLEEL